MIRRYNTISLNFLTYLRKNNFNNIVIRLLLGLITILLVVSCSFVNVEVEPIGATVKELSVCKGADEIGKPVGVSKVFSPEEERIFACGYLETLQPIDIDIQWYYKNELVFRQTGKDIKGYFYYFIRPEKIDAFPEGAYRIDVLIGGVVAESTEFRVEQP
ncbi:MAG: hypothetical protein AB1801_15155 [Chloroflexota bacterium]